MSSPCTPTPPSPRPTATGSSAWPATARGRWAWVEAGAGYLHRWKDPSSNPSVGGPMVQAAAGFAAGPGRWPVHPEVTVGAIVLPGVALWAAIGARY